ncbi:WD40 repeat domain-containing protein [Chloropicon primus]|uniref:WD40 repeat domain-containing protein n=2 Tax=Chloropicon primus TaxID=1764295 RepID=A0A5B8MPY3_9CHLO|nr:WD40 repeat domain-containing protein [Chloropicon primus]UPR01718.1 WD40 repeat domain-containing protein [Chloropicon primus]|eukprot:QDZ22497.1 WD40 repeat domain-containing protein [Chloropicon primus]
MSEGRPGKRAKSGKVGGEKQNGNKTSPGVDAEVTEVIIGLRGQDGNEVGPPLKVPLSIEPKNLEVLVNKLKLADGGGDGDEDGGGFQPYSFFINEVELTGDLRSHLHKHGNSLENLEVTFKPQAWFKVLPVSRCSATMTGHSESVLSVHFSPDGSNLASGSGDTTVRLWDLNTQTRRHECKGHKNWVLVVSWSPDSTMLASGGMDSLIMLWDPATGKPAGTLRGHKDSITSISWEPAHLRLPSKRFCSSSKDKSIRVWDALTKQCLFSMHSHRQAVTCAKWSGTGLIYSSSRDTNIYVWETERGRLVKQLQGHGHWVNTLALSSEHALSQGPFDHKGKRPEGDAEAMEAAKKKYEEALGGQPERLVSGSDDFTMFLWCPSKSKHHTSRLTGHKNLVNQVRFSPNGQWIASASFDKSVKLWNGHTGVFVCSFFGHVAPVYQVSWSADSRLICSGSKDSTLKVWDLRTKKLRGDLPGHADEVFTVDWCTSGTFVASGGRDHVLKLWRH